MIDKVPSSNAGVRAAQLNRWAALNLKVAHMSVTQSDEVGPKSKLLPWCGTLAAFLAASGIQVVIYGVGAAGPGGSLRVPDPVYYLVMLIWLFVPAAVAAWISLRFLRFIRAARDRLTAIANLLLLLLAPLSIYLGLFISFNTWGS